MDPSCCCGDIRREGGRSEEGRDEGGVAMVSVESGDSDHQQEEEDTE